jgi:membrane associated rhomboid family serine protease
MNILLVILGYVVAAFLMAACLLRWPPFGLSAEEFGAEFAVFFLALAWPATIFGLVAAFLAIKFLKAASWLATMGRRTLAER